MITGQWNRYKKPKDNQKLDTTYPFTLGYTKPNGEKVSVEIHNDEQAEDEYHNMWWFCGHDVSFSVDQAGYNESR